ncbi:MAG: sulfatase-like hydrolase/transferase [Planctomycetota bacterium]
MQDNLSKNHWMDRRDFLRMAGAGSLAAMAALRQATGQEKGDGAARRPNVVLIYTDDHDLDEIGCYGGKVLSPHMDSLARDGMKFTRFYVSSAVCSPSRYNALTGRYASRSLRQQKNWPPGGPVNIGWEAGCVNEITLAGAMKAGGYATGMVGKWHQGTLEPLTQFLADAEPDDPKVKKALEENYAKVIAAIKSTGFDYAAAAYINNVDGGGKDGPKRFWLPKKLRYHNMEWVTQGALEFIEQNKERPFFLYMAPTLVHGPSPVKSMRADARITPLGYLDRAPEVQPPRQDVFARVKAAGVAENMAGVTWLDDGVGAVLKKLDEMGLAENTVVLLAGDNGNKAKFTCYDGGGLMPFVARWKGVITAGSLCDKLASNVDFAPTILALCGVAKPAEMQIDGVSFLPALKGDPGYRRDSLYLEITTERGVVTDDRFKYIAVRYLPKIQEEIAKGKKFNHWCKPAEAEDHTFNADKNYPGYYDADQLYDLNADPNEQKNLAADSAHKTKLEEMKRLLTEYCRTLPHTFGEFKTG